MRSTRALARVFGLRSQRTAKRTGQTRIVNAAPSKARKIATTEPTRANPAPGPM